MPKKKATETQAEQSARFKKAVRDAISAGELDPREADKQFAQVMDGAAKLHQHWLKGEAEEETPP